MASVSKMAPRGKVRAEPSPPALLDEGTLQFDILNNQDPRKAQSFGLWDMTPWGVAYTTAELRKDNLLKSLEREFTARGQRYKVTIQPARIERNGVTTEVYPGEQEMLVELAVRKIAVRDRELRLNRSERVSLTIGLYTILKELRQYGHEMNTAQIEEALRVLQRSNIEISRVDFDRDGDPYDTILSSTIFPVMLLRKSRVASKQDNSTVSIEVNPLISEAIMSLDFHDIDYDTLMRLPSVSRWVFKAINHDMVYQNAAETGREVGRHVLRASEIQKLCGMGGYSRPRDAFAKIGKHLERLKAAGHLVAIEEEGVFEGTGVRKTRVDVIYTLTVSASMLAASHAAKDGRENNVIAFRSQAGSEPRQGWVRKTRVRKGKSSDQATLDLIPTGA